MFGSTATPLTPDQRNSFTAALPGRMMDTFDYSIVVFVDADIAGDFGVSLTQMAFLTTATLLMSPVGAVIFGLWADRRGRRVPLLVDVTCSSVVGVLCAYAPDFTVLLVLRLLYGIGGAGGGEDPREAPRLLLRRAAAGPLARLPAGVARVVAGHDGSRAVVALAVRARHRPGADQPADPDPVHEPEVWQLYPTFPGATDDGGAGLSAATATGIAVIYHIGATIGGVALGSLSERFGRRHTIAFAAVIGLPIVPLFALSTTAGFRCLGSFLMQVMVQGAWDVIPVRLTEMSRTRSAVSTPASPISSGTVPPPSTR